jgi:uncharacterized protein (DUF1501 family)
MTTSATGPALPQRHISETKDTRATMDETYLEGLPTSAPRHDQRPVGMHAGCDCGQAPPAVDPWRKGFTRRRLMQGSTAMVAALGLQLVTTKHAFSASPALNTDTIVVINLRGGWDSVNVVVPTFENEYYALRPNIAIAKAAALPLAGGFGLHPALTGIHKLYQAGHFAPVVGVGTPDMTLSHFEAMDTLERGTATGFNESGWMNRLLQVRGDSGTFSAVQFGTQIPLGLYGPAPALALDRIQSFGLAGYDDVSAQATTAFTSLYRGSTHPMAIQAQDTLSAIDQVAKVRASKYEVAGGAAYPDGEFGDRLRDTAELIKRKVGLTISSMDVGGWDMHTNGGGITGDLADHMKELDAGLTAFVKDLGVEFNNVTIVVVSEFGRTLRENGTRGTEHGHGQCMWVMGGNLNGGKVYGTWPGAAPGDLVTNGSLAGTTDYRDVLGDVLTRRGGVGSLTKIFPDHSAKPLGIAKARG